MQLQASRGTLSSADDDTSAYQSDQCHATFLLVTTEFVGPMHRYAFPAGPPLGRSTPCPLVDGRFRTANEEEDYPRPAPCQRRGGIPSRTAYAGVRLSG